MRSALPLARFGHSRDERSGNPQSVCGLLTHSEGCPVTVEVFPGNTADPKTVAAQALRLCQRFGLQRLVLVEDRGMLTSARVREDLQPVAGIEWIAALRAPAIVTQALSPTAAVSPLLTSTSEGRSPEWTSLPSVCPGLLYLSTLAVAARLGLCCGARYHLRTPRSDWKYRGTKESGRTAPWEADL